MECRIVGNICDARHDEYQRNEEDRKAKAFQLTVVLCAALFWDDNVKDTKHSGMRVIRECAVGSYELSRVQHDLIKRETDIKHPEPR